MTSSEDKAKYAYYIQDVLRQQKYGRSIQKDLLELKSSGLGKVSTYMIDRIIRTALSEYRISRRHNSELEKAKEQTPEEKIKLAISLLQSAHYKLENKGGKNEIT